MLIRLALLIAATAGVTCRAAEEHVVGGTTSPNKKMEVVEVRTKGGDRDYYFVLRSSGKKVGVVLPVEQRGEISNVAVVASWNRKSTSVALLVFYGTKLSQLLLYARNADGKIVQIELPEPDPLALYRERTGKAIPQPGDGFSENGLGPWLDESTICLVAGEAKQTENVGQYNHVFVTFRARITGRRAKISHLELIGPLSNAQKEDFAKKWGRHYFEAGEERTSK